MQVRYDNWFSRGRRPRGSPLRRAGAKQLPLHVSQHVFDLGSLGMIPARFIPAQPAGDAIIDIMVRSNRERRVSPQCPPGAEIMPPAGLRRCQSWRSGKVTRILAGDATLVQRHANMGTVIKRGERVFLALRKQRLRGPRVVFHAVTPYCRIALCCAEPGPRSGWAEPPAAEVTCPSCLQRLQRL